MEKKNVNYRSKRVFTYTYILHKRTEKIMAELSKKNNNQDNLNNMMMILKKVISNEKLIFPRLKVFESFCPVAKE